MATRSKLCTYVCLLNSNQKQLRIIQTNTYDVGMYTNLNVLLRVCCMIYNIQVRRRAHIVLIAHQSSIDNSRNNSVSRVPPNLQNISIIL